MRKHDDVRFSRSRGGKGCGKGRGTIEVRSGGAATTCVVLRTLDGDPRGIQRGVGRLFVPRPLDSLEPTREEMRLSIPLSLPAFPFASLCVQHAHVRLSIPPVPAGTQDHADAFPCAMPRGNRPARLACRGQDKESTGTEWGEGVAPSKQEKFYISNSISLP